MKKIVITLFGLILIALIIFIVKGRFGNKENVLTTESTPNLATHPVYSSYEFSEKDNTINIGDQPLYLPTSLISEAMKHDLLLKEAMSRYNLEIRFYPFFKGDDVNFFIRRGNLQAGIGGDMPALTAAASTEIIIPGLMQQGYCSIVANRSMLIKGLKGKRVAYAFGSNAHFALLKALESGKLTEADVNLVSMEAPDMPEALANGKIDAYSAWEPTPAISLSKYPYSTVIHRNLSSGYIYFTKTFYEQNQEATKHIVAAQLRAMRWMQADKQNLLKASRWALQRIKKFSGTNIGLTAEQIAELALNDLLGKDSVPFVPKSFLADNGPLQKELSFLRKLNKISTSCTWSRVHNSFDRQIIKEIISNSEKYKLNKFMFE